MTTLADWAHRWGITPAALSDLQATLLASEPQGPPMPPGVRSEAAVQAVVRLAATRAGFRLWRNNVGVLMDARGIPVRFGLANDSPQVNKMVKSADLVGIRPVLITPAHVGHTIGQFYSRECKAPGWRYTGTDHEQAQRRWADIVLGLGGDAAFTTGDC